MALLVPDAGELELLLRMLNKNAPDNCKLHLYSNNYTPVEGSVAANFTEVAATGYAAISLTGANWTGSTVAGTTEASYAEQTFTMTSATAVYGYYITNNAGTIVLWAELFAGGPFNIPAGGGTVKVTPKIQLA